MPPKSLNLTAKSFSEIPSLRTISQGSSHLSPSLTPPPMEPVLLCPGEEERRQCERKVENGDCLRDESWAQGQLPVLTA